MAGTEADLSGCRRGEGAFFHQGASGWCLQAMEIAPHHHRGGAGTQRRRCRRLALWGAGKGRGGPGRVLPGWGTPGGGVGVRSPRLGRRVLEQLGADGQGEAPSFLQRPPPLPASTMDGAEGEGRVPTMGWLHFGVLMPILHANSVRLIRVCSRVDSLRGLFPCSPGRRGKTLIEWCLVRKSPPPPPPRTRPSTSRWGWGSHLHSGDHLPRVAVQHLRVAGATEEPSFHFPFN